MNDDQNQQAPQTNSQETPPLPPPPTREDNSTVAPQLQTEDGSPFSKAKIMLKKASPLLSSDEFSRKMYSKVSILAITGAVIVLAFGSLIYMLYGKASNQRAVLGEHLEKIAQLDELTSDTNKLKTNLELLTINNNDQKVLSLLPEELNEDELLVFLSNTATTSSVQLTSYQPELGSLSNAATPTIAFRLTINGSYATITDFLRQIESGARLVDIIDISFENSISFQASNTNRLNAVVTGTAYYQGEDTGPEVIEEDSDLEAGDSDNQQTTEQEEQ